MDLLCLQCVEVRRDMGIRPSDQVRGLWSRKDRVKNEGREAKILQQASHGEGIDTIGRMLRALQVSVVNRDEWTSRMVEDFRKMMRDSSRRKHIHETYPWLLLPDEASNKKPPAPEDTTIKSCSRKSDSGGLYKIVL